MKAIHESPAPIHRFLSITATALTASDACTLPDSQYAPVDAVDEGNNAALVVAVAAGNIGHWSRSAVRVGEVDFWASIFVAELTVAL